MVSFGDVFFIGRFIVFCIIVIPIGLIIGKKLYHNVKQEEHLEKGKVLQRIMKTYVVVQCFAWPSILSLMGVMTILARTVDLTEDNPPLETLLRAMISIYKFLYTLTICYVGFNSLITAICRYIFIVVVQHNDVLTIKRIRKWILISSIIVPILLGISHEATVPMHKTWVNILGHMIAPEHDSMALISTHEKRNITIKLHQSPLFNFVDEYFPCTIKLGIKTLFTVLKVVIFSNVIEGCLYTHIYIINRRSENKGVVNVLMSEESRIKRNRTKTINLQMTVISWSLEFVAGFIVLLQLVDRIKSFEIQIPLAIFTMVFNFIIIPSTYLLNTTFYKAFIVTQGWWKWFRTLISSNQAASTNQVALEPNINPNSRLNSKVVPSKNVDKKSNRCLDAESQSNIPSQSNPSVSGMQFNQDNRNNVLYNNYM